MKKSVRLISITFASAVLIAYVLLLSCVQITAKGYNEIANTTTPVILAANIKLIENKNALDLAIESHEPKLKGSVFLGAEDIQETGTLNQFIYWYNAELGLHRYDGTLIDFGSSFNQEKFQLISNFDVTYAVNEISKLKKNAAKYHLQEQISNNKPFRNLNVDTEQKLLFENLLVDNIIVDNRYDINVLMLKDKSIRLFKKQIKDPFYVGLKLVFGK